jgi:hypothetical protein
MVHFVAKMSFWDKSNAVLMSVRKEEVSGTVVEYI